MLQQIFSGSPAYCNRKVAELKKRGWQISKRKLWSDGKFSYTMVKEQTRA